MHVGFPRTKLPNPKTLISLVPRKTRSTSNLFFPRVRLHYIFGPGALGYATQSNRKPCREADIWSLGVVFYELLTLEPPFKALASALRSAAVLGPCTCEAQQFYSVLFCSTTGVHISVQICMYSYNVFYIYLSICLYIYVDYRYIHTLQL